MVTPATRDIQHGITRAAIRCASISDMFVILNVRKVSIHDEINLKREGCNRAIPRSHCGCSLPIIAAINAFSRLDNVCTSVQKKRMGIGLANKKPLSFIDTAFCQEGIFFSIFYAFGNHLYLAPEPPRQSPSNQRDCDSGCLWIS